MNEERLINGLRESKTENTLPVLNYLQVRQANSLITSQKMFRVLKKENYIFPFTTVCCMSIPRDT